MSMSEITQYGDGSENNSGQPTPGTQLAMRRQQFHWTVEQVAAQLNLAPRQIEAIEADNFAALPVMAVTRGFIRAYAKLLKLDPAPLMAQIGGGPQATDPLPLRRTIPATSFQPNRLASSSRERKPGKIIFGIAVLALLAGAAYLAMQRGNLDSVLPQTVSAKLGSATKTEQQSAAPAEAPGRVVETDVTPPLNAAAASAPSPVNPIAAGGAVPAASAAAASNPLVLTMREDSWVEIKRADNSTLVSRVIRSGSTESFDIAGPVTLTVGNARGVDASLRGEALNLKSTSKNNVARIRVQ
jgi:cytoskeleton protein RodZ